MNSEVKLSSVAAYLALVISMVTAYVVFSDKIDGLNGREPGMCAIDGGVAPTHYH